MEIKVSWETLVIKWAKNFIKVIICFIRIRRVWDTAPANGWLFVFKIFHWNIRKVALKYETLLCFFYMNYSATKNMGKWSEISDFIIPVLNLVVVLMKIWSIAAVVFLVMRAVLLITGIMLLPSIILRIYLFIYFEFIYRWQNFISTYN